MRGTWGALRAFAAVLILLVGAPLALAERSQEADLLFERGARAMRQGEFQTAVERLEAAIEQAPEDAEIRAAYAQALLGVGRVDEALAEMDRVRELDPNLPELPLVSGMVHFQGGRWDEARERLSDAVARDPGNSRAHLLLGVTHHELGNFEAADRSLQEALRLDPGLDDEVEYRLGLLRIAQQDYGSAKEFLERVEGRDPDSALAQSASAFLDSLEGRKQKDWSVYVKLGTEFDSNVNVAGDDDDLEISEEEDIRLITEFGGDVVLLDNDRFRVRAGGLGYLSVHADEDDFDVQALRLWTVGTAKLHSQLQADLYYGYEQLWVDWDGFRRTHAVEPALRIFPFAGNEQWLTRIFYRWEDRNFSGDPIFEELDRDGQIQHAGIDQYYRMLNPLGFGPGYVRLGYRRRWAATHGADYDSRGNQIVGTLGLALPMEARVTADVRFERRHYASDNVLDFGGRTGNREDRITRTRLGVSRPFETPVGDVTLELGHRFISRASNVEFFDYERHIFYLHATYRY